MFVLSLTTTSCACVNLCIDFKKLISNIIFVRKKWFDIITIVGETTNNILTSSEVYNRLLNLYKLSLEIFDNEILVNLFKLLKDKNITNLFLLELNLTLLTNSLLGA